MAWSRLGFKCNGPCFLEYLKKKSRVFHSLIMIDMLLIQLKSELRLPFFLMQLPVCLPHTIIHWPNRLFSGFPQSPLVTLSSHGCFFLPKDSDHFSIPLLFKSQAKLYKVFLTRFIKKSLFFRACTSEQELRSCK